MGKWSLIYKLDFARQICGCFLNASHRTNEGRFDIGLLTVQVVIHSDLNYREKHINTIGAGCSKWPRCGSPSSLDAHNEASSDPRFPFDLIGPEAIAFCAYECLCRVQGVLTGAVGILFRPAFTADSGV